MKFYVNYDCGFDENDGDECKNYGTLDHPLEGGEWIIDDTKIEDLKLLAIIDHFLYESMGGDDENATYNDVSYEAALNKVLKDKFLKKIGCTEEEIQKACEEFDINYYMPSAHSMCAEPHDHWFSIEIVPVENDQYEISDRFILKRIKAIAENKE